MKTFPRLVAALILYSATRPALSHAGDYQGADAVLRQAAALVDKNASGTTPSPADPVHQWRADLRVYRERTPALPPGEAAGQWLTLFDRALRLPGPLNDFVGGGDDTSHLTDLFRVLPPPAVWDALDAQAALRPEAGKGSSDFSTPVLRIITGTLRDDPDAVRRALEAFKRQVEAEDNPERDQNRETIHNLQQVFHEATTDTAGKLRELEAELALLESGASSLSTANAQQNLQAAYLEVPNLVALVGEPRAEALLRRIFAQPFVTVRLTDEPTQTLARKVLLAMGEKIQCAPWSLVSGPEAVPLYELLARRFPETVDNRSERLNAKPAYLLGLIALGRDADATALALELPGETSSGGVEVLNLSSATLQEVAARGQATKVAHFFDVLLTAHRDLPYWGSFQAAATAAGNPGIFLTRVQTAIGNPDLRPRFRRSLRLLQASALLAVDRLPEAVSTLEVLASPPATDTDADGGEDTLRFDGDSPKTYALLLALIARRTHDDKLLNEQLDRLLQGNRALLQAPFDPNNVVLPLGIELNDLFLATGRGPELEGLLLDNLARSTQAAAHRRSEMTPEMFAESGSFETRNALEILVDLYSQAGRYADVVALLDHAPSWETGDVAGLLPGTMTAFDGQVARALQRTGHADAALRVVNASLDHALDRSGLHPVYALLLELLPPDQAEARLNALAAADPFDAQPLLWRGILQWQQHRPAEAEKSIRQALAVDPTDGDGGPLTRPLAHAVLGDILEHAGDTKGAAEARRFVEAVHLGQEADTLSGVGLSTRAVGLYAKAVGVDLDLGFLQYGYAVQLAALGRFEEAAAHFARADELLPASSSRVAILSPANGQVFDSTWTQAIAERVFSGRAAHDPDNPHAHYLMGSLRVTQGRTVEAARAFREAVRLDPDYLYAWERLAAVTGDPPDRDQATVNILRLDPHRRHRNAAPDLSGVNDLKALWPALEQVAAHRFPTAADLYPLMASRAAMAGERSSHPPAPADGPEPPDLSGAALRAQMDGFDPPPWAAVLRHPVISAALQSLRPSGDAGTP